MSTGTSTPATPSSATTAAAGPHRIAQIAVIIEELDRAVAFYRDTLGLRFLFQAPPGMAFFECGGIRLMLTRAEEEGEGIPASGTSVIYYAVPDIRATYAALRAKGVRFEDEPHFIATLGDRDLWMTFFRDSENNLLALTSEVPR
jgi:methylmalonyl-CoA/ethylmalonyl-CoA epimerase